ncbi:MAG: DUF3488 and DUF4129 domain-containing transglutaminase family protein [Cyanobacteria bacterium P01_A01_bin.45]
MFKFPKIIRLWRLCIARNQWKYQPDLPLKKVEDSITLRVLVLALVIVGITATDIAAQTIFSLWGVPLSLIGAVWSYYRRYRQNVAVKFFIAILMLATLGNFFAQLIGQLNDTRLILAELLIQLQVLHSFDTPRRKDLGYSIVIGLILLGVAASISQTLTFAIWLFLFLAIALPTLILDYRSRLGIGAWKFQKKGFQSQNFTSVLPRYILLLSLAIALGLGIFAVLPRFPGYQLRTFPVSSPIDLKNSQNGRSILNPGYVRNSDRNSVGGNGNFSGESKGGQPGKLDNNFYYGFSSKINQNLRGEMKPKIVMRVRSQAEGFWRVLAFDRYTGKGWEISRNDKVNRFRRSPWSYQTLLSVPFFRNKTKEIVQTYTVVSELPNLIPAMSYPKEIYFPTPMIGVDKEGSLRSPVGLNEGLTYTVISEVPLRDRSVLGKIKANYPKNIKEHYLQIPTEISDQVRQHTEKIIANYKKEQIGKTEKTLSSDYEKALYLAQYLKQRYSVPENPLALPYLKEDEDLVEAFLFKHQGGYPDHFSTVLTIMLRSIGIPARLVAGFSPGEFNPFTGMYIVRNTDAHAMTEVYFPKHGWFAFDPIPNHPLIPPSVEEIKNFTVLRQFWNWVAQWLPSPVTGWISYVLEVVFGWITKVIGWIIALFSQGWMGVLSGSIISTLVAFFTWFFWKQYQEIRYQLKLSKLPPMESLYQQMIRSFSQKGNFKHPSQTPYEYTQVLYQYHSPGITEVTNEICQAYVKWRYGGYNPDIIQLKRKWKSIKKVNYSRKI